MMGTRDSLADLLNAVGGDREGESTYELFENIAIALNPLVDIYAKPESTGPTDQAHTIHGRVAKELQSDIRVVGDNIYGTLKWATGLVDDGTAYPDGNYLGILLECGFLPEVLAPDADPVELLPPGLQVSYKLSDEATWTTVPTTEVITGFAWITPRISDNKHQTLLIQTRSDEFPTFERIYYLNNLVCLRE